MLSNSHLLEEDNDDEEEEEEGSDGSMDDDGAVGSQGSEGKGGGRGVWKPHTKTLPHKANTKRAKTKPLRMTARSTPSPGRL